MRENNGGGNLTKIYCKRKCKCHNVSPLNNYYVQMNKTKKHLLIMPREVRNHGGRVHNLGSGNSDNVSENLAKVFSVC
jgi:hypothetical protein